MIIITTILTSTPQIGSLFFFFFFTSGADKTKILFYPLSPVPSGTVPLYLPPSSPPSQTSLSLEASLFCHKATRTMIMGPCFFTVFLSHTPTRSGQSHPNPPGHCYQLLLELGQITFAFSHCPHMQNGNADTTFLTKLSCK